MSGRGTITMSANEKRDLERKAKAGWKTYFLLLERYNDLSEYQILQREHNRQLATTIRSGGEVDLEFLKKQFVDMYEKLGELTDCPVCFETLTKENSVVPNCGHMLCKTCKDKICEGNKECPICKAKLY